MSHVNKLESLPFAGNLVPTRYKIECGNSFSRVVNCYSVRLVEPIFDSDALLISEKDLFNARTRFVSCVGQLPNVDGYTPGKFYDVKIKSANKNGKINKNLVIMFYGGNYCGSDYKEPVGFLFAGSDFKESAMRALKLKATVRRLTFWQKFKMYICKWFNNFPKEV